MSKHVGGIIIVMNCILLSASVGGSVDCKKVHGMDHTKRTSFVRHSVRMKCNPVPSVGSSFTSAETQTE